MHKSSEAEQQPDDLESLVKEAADEDAVALGEGGDLHLQIGWVDGQIVLHFGRPVEWIGFTKEQAKKIARAIMDEANPVTRKGP